VGRRLIVLIASGTAFAVLAVSASHGPNAVLATTQSPQQASSCLDWGSPGDTSLHNDVSFAIFGGSVATGVFCIEFGRDGVCTEWSGGPPNEQGNVTVVRVYRGPCGKIGEP
jgi:hypothetical protein